MLERKAKLKIVDQKESVYLCSVQFVGNDKTEFDSFLTSFEGVEKYKKDFDIIIAALGCILERGALERRFRPESKMGDGVGALPLESGKLRLYCLRVSDQLLIIGNGGVKTTKTYNEDPHLRNCVYDLASLDKSIKRKSSITKGEFKNIERINFNI